MNLFDDLANKFARATDVALEQNNYPRGRLIVEMVSASVPRGGRIIDYGCGPGRLSRLLAVAGFRVRGLDISQPMLDEARKLDRSNLDLEFLPIVGPDDRALAAASCDAVVCSSVIEYVADPEGLLACFRTVLHPGGVLVISYANRSSLWRRYWRIMHPHQNRMYREDNWTWNWREFRGLLERNGFRTMLGPTYYESPFDRYPLGRWLRRCPLGGSLAVVAARAAAAR